MDDIIIANIVIAGCIFITGIAVGVVCGIAMGGGVPKRGLTGIITTTSKGNLCGLPGSVETYGLGEIKKPRKHMECCRTDQISKKSREEGVIQ